MILKFCTKSNRNFKNSIAFYFVSEYNNDCYITYVIKEKNRMPPIPKISKQMILESSIEIIRKDGIENLNVRNIANKLSCSTQPIMYHYKNMGILKEELYTMVNEYHSEFLMKESNINPLLNIGLQYIKFANEEKNLFKFLFQSNKFSNFNFEDLIDDNESNLQSIFDIVQKETKLSGNQIKEKFTILFIIAHGIASLLANNSMTYNEKECMKILEQVFYKN